MPQIAQLSEVYSSQIFWLLLVFGAIFLVVGLGMVPKVTSTVDARTNSIGADLAAAEAARATADNEEAKWRANENAKRADAQKIIAEAKASAAQTTEKTLAKSNERLAGKIAKAEAGIAEAREKALGEIENVAADSAKDIAAKLAGLKISEGDALKAAKGALANG